MSLTDALSQNPRFKFSNTIFYQVDLLRSQIFEEKYIELRKQENRIFSDEIVRRLPDISRDHPLRAEWDTRKASMRKLLSYLRRRGPGKLILEVGCGNGWLSQHLAQLPGTQVLGIDINEFELLQAARIFPHANLCWAYANVQERLNLPPVDIAVFASSLQYFREPGLLFRHIIEMLRPGGEIHILDTPIYESGDEAFARSRSEKYFSDRKSRMVDSYFHHSWDIFRDFNATILHKPDSLTSRIAGIVSTNSPFPWVRITK